MFLYNKKGELGIAKRAATKKFLPGKYELVGGRVESGETKEEGLVREGEEELHLTVVLGEAFYEFAYSSDDADAVETIYFATLQDDSQEIRINPEDHSEFRWITEDQIEEFLLPDDEETKAVRKGFEILRQKTQ